MSFQRKICIWVRLAGIWKKTIAIFLISNLDFFQYAKFMQN